MKPIHIVPIETKMKFVKFRILTFTMSALLVLGSFVYTIWGGLNFGIDFAGGTLIEVRVPEAQPLGTLRQSLNGLGLGNISIQEFGQPDDLLIRVPEQKSLDEEGQQKALDTIRGAINDLYEGEVDYRRVEYVGPQVGDELIRSGIWAVVLSLGGIMAYVWFQFRWQFALAGIAALIHDVMLTVGFFAVTGMEFSLATLAGVLMVGGYSINDTVVVFDRVREMMRKYKKMALGDVLDKSLNQTMSRTILTGGTTLLALIALLVFGGEVIRSFVYALVFGILIGTYSSIFIATPLLMHMGVRRAVAKDNDAS